VNDPSLAVTPGTEVGIVVGAVTMGQYDRHVPVQAE
jgi:hypothetical protein